MTTALCFSQGRQKKFAWLSRVLITEGVNYRGCRRDVLLSCCDWFKTLENLCSRRRCYSFVLDLNGSSISGFVWRFLVALVGGKQVDAAFCGS
ncbi:hypothetical protein L596_012550 [Steinernema carpocapsae]|uniref:Uncharacterized protein n=1 Tax=Steinernema carpocapsae TaxID=34508 RepID=A0A4V6A4V6_STECR|nr:hypothetical protein L596_012550 [Steinernema carpocapsae]